MRKTELPILAFVCFLAAFGSAAEAESVRIGPGIRDADGHPFPGMTSVSRIIETKGRELGLFVQGFSDCPAIVTRSLKGTHPRDDLRQTWTMIQTIRVECWAFLQADPDAHVELAASSDWNGAAVIHGIMAYAEGLTAWNEKWEKVLMTFPGGDITCSEDLRCLLVLPDGRDPPERSLEFDLLTAMGDERFIQVTQMVYGRAGFVYGVRWRETEDGGQVVSIFPDILKP
jgi:hypothetical protein